MVGFAGLTLGGTPHGLHEGAEKWTATQEGTFVLSIEEGFDLGHRTNRAVFGAALGSGQHDAGASPDVNSIPR